MQLENLLIVLPQSSLRGFFIINVFMFFSICIISFYLNCEKKTILAVLALAPVKSAHIFLTELIYYVNF